MNTKRSNFMNPTQITANGKPVNNPKNVSNTFNNFVICIGPNTEQSIPKSQTAPSSTDLKNFVIAYTQQMRN